MPGHPGRGTQPFPFPKAFRTTPVWATPLASIVVIKARHSFQVSAGRAWMNVACSDGLFTLQHNWKCVWFGMWWVSRGSPAPPPGMMTNLWTDTVAPLCEQALPEQPAHQATGTGFNRLIRQHPPITWTRSRVFKWSLLLMHFRIYCGSSWSLNS